jgi:hypothetical protein
MSTPFHELEHELESEFEHEHEGEFEGEGELEGEGEFEGEFEHEHEHEHEHELNPTRRVYLDAMLEMEHLMSAASQAEHETEAEQFFPLLLPLAAKLAPFALKGAAKLGAKMLPKLLPRAGKILTRVAPRLIKGVGRIGRLLRRRRATRPALRALPTIVRRTVGAIARQAARGRNVTPQTAQRILTQQARRVLQSPQQVRRAMRISRAADRIYHQRQAQVCKCPPPRPQSRPSCGCASRRGCCC